MVAVVMMCVHHGCCGDDMIVLMMMKWSRGGKKQSWWQPWWRPRRERLVTRQDTGNRRRNKSTGSKTLSLWGVDEWECGGIGYGERGVSWGFRWWMLGEWCVGKSEKWRWWLRSDDDGGGEDYGSWWWWWCHMLTSSDIDLSLLALVVTWRMGRVKWRDSGWRRRWKVMRRQHLWDLYQRS